jgi:hypothetical protein
MGQKFIVVNRHDAKAYQPGEAALTHLPDHLKALHVPLQRAQLLNGL